VSYGEGISGGRIELGPTFCIVVSTYRRRQLLSRCLKNLSRLEIPHGDAEVRVMDNGADPKTREMVDGFFEEIPGLHYHAVMPPGLHACRNTGFEISAAEFLCYLDDDVCVDSNWLTGVADGFSDPATVLVGGPILPEFEAEPPDWFATLWIQNRYGRCLPHYTLLDFGTTAQDIPPRFVWGCNFSIRRSTLAESGGFHPDSLPRDLLRYRGDGESAVARYVSDQGHRARYVPSAAVTHWVSRDRMDETYLLRRAFNQGVSDSYTRLRERGGNIVDSYPYYLYARARDCWDRLRPGHKNRHRRIDSRMRRAYWGGFRFHLQECRRDPLLLEWICRPDYFGERGVIPAGDDPR
jgi:cellulose synthase/poly-beta-1,6-N-acetylglucosamine synthase-like glycosyltransferase